MKNRIFWALAATCLLTVSCTKEIFEPQQGEVVKTPITISARYEGTKVNYSESNGSISATWEEDDSLLVVCGGYVDTLHLVDGAGSTNATFAGELTGTPAEGAMLVCYVKDCHTPNATITIGTDGSYVYSNGAFLAQDGTMAYAAHLNLYCGWTRYASGTAIPCAFVVNTSMLKFTVTTPYWATAGQTATLTYKTDGTELAKASFTSLAAGSEHTYYLAVPSGRYTGPQTIVYKIGDNEETYELSATQANFVAGNTYSKEIQYPSAVFEVTQANFTTQVAAFNSSEEANPVLRFTQDIIGDLSITRNNGVVDFNTHTLYNYSDPENPEGDGNRWDAHVFLRNTSESGKSITLRNGRVWGFLMGDDPNGDEHLYNGTVILENLTVNRSIYTDGHYYIIRSGNYFVNDWWWEGSIHNTHGTVTIYGGTFYDNLNTTESTGASYIINGGAFINNCYCQINSGCSGIINGGTFSTALECSGSTCTINGGSFGWILASNGSTVTINTASGTAVQASFNSAVTINNGENFSNIGCYYGSSITIHGGTFSEPISVSETYNDVASTITIDGGKFRSSLNASEGCSFSLSGGKYAIPTIDFDEESHPILSTTYIASLNSWCVSGYSLQDNTDPDSETYQKKVAPAAK